MPRSDQPQMNITFSKESEANKILVEIAKRYSALKIKPTTAARIFIEERLELFKSGWKMNDPDTLRLLELCISNKNPPSSGTLRQLRLWAKSKGAEEGHEDQFLKAREIVPELIHCALEQVYAGLDLNDMDARLTLTKIIEKPHLFKAVGVLSQMNKEQLLKFIDTYEASISQEKAG